MRCDTFAGTDRRIINTHRQYHHHHHKSFNSSVTFPVLPLVEPKWEASMADHAGTTAARQRRERRLRAAWKHEQLSVAMALAAATHHSAPRGECQVPYDALRGQKTASAAGMRSAPLAEVAEPQGGAVTVGYVGALVPLLPCRCWRARQAKWWRSE